MWLSDRVITAMEQTEGFDLQAQLGQVEAAYARTHNGGVMAQEQARDALAANYLLEAVSDSRVMADVAAHSAPLAQNIVFWANDYANSIRYNTYQLGNTRAMQSIILGSGDYTFLSQTLPELYRQVNGMAGLDADDPENAFFFLRQAAFMDEPGARRPQGLPPNNGHNRQHIQEYGPEAWNYEKDRLKDVKRFCYDVQTQVSITLKNPATGKDVTVRLDAIGYYIGQDGKRYTVMLEFKSTAEAALSPRQEVAKKSAQENHSGGTVTSPWSDIYEANSQLKDTVFVELRPGDDAEKLIYEAVNGRPKK